jgi:hypothetical protein
MIRMTKKFRNKGYEYDILVVIENENTQNENIFLSIEAKGEIKEFSKSIPLISKDWIEMTVKLECQVMDNHIDSILNGKKITAQSICLDLGFETEVITSHE